MKQWETLDAVERHPDRVSGAWVLRGTRVPVSAPAPQSKTRKIRLRLDSAGGYNSLLE
jgi:hypothetical protein